MILIDVCHDYSYVKIDGAKAVKHVRPGGTIFWYDYGQCREVTQAVDELARDHPHRCN